MLKYIYRTIFKTGILKDSYYQYFKKLIQNHACTQLHTVIKTPFLLVQFISGHGKSVYVGYLESGDWQVYVSIRKNGETNCKVFIGQSSSETLGP